MFFIDIDECVSFFCVYGNCMDQVNGYVCECIFGYIGVICEIGIQFMIFLLLFLYGCMKCFNDRNEKYVKVYDVY